MPLQALIAAAIKEARRRPQKPQAKRAETHAGTIPANVLG
jgi:DNA-binding protein YbaB